MGLIEVEDVQTLLKIPQSTAYKIIRDLNAELKRQGYYTIRGKIEETYLLKRFGIPHERNGHGTQNSGDQQGAKRSNKDLAV
jgi:hypothetical protein